MAEPFTLPTLEDLDAELREVGIEIDPGALAPGDDDAAANHYLRALAAIDLEIARLTRAEAQARALIEVTYNRQREQLRARRAQVEAIVLDIARRTDFGGKRKSRAVVYGEYGRRASAETIKITDQEAAISWCEANGYEILVMTETKVVKKLPHAAVKPVLLAYIARTGEEPPGIQHVAAKDEPYCKAAPAILAAERGDAQETIE